LTGRITQEKKGEGILVTSLINVMNQ